MRYENRLPPEGINTTQVHPLKQFAQLAIGSIVLVVILVMLLQFSGSFLARRIPFSFERAVMEQLDIQMGESQKSPQMTAYLNSLAARVSAHLPMPEGMSVTVHYDSEELFNAFATVGGNLLFYRGLLERMPDENTLAMVMAHEISHVLHRDPVASLGGGVVSAVALLGLTGNAGTGMAGQLMNSAGMLTSVQFTRKMEVAADKQALAGVNALYGHLNGASTLFELFSEARGESASKTTGSVWVERFFSTHPRDEDRTGSIAEIAAENGWQTTGDVTPLPADFKLWLESEGS